VPPGRIAPHQIIHSAWKLALPVLDSVQIQVSFQGHLHQDVSRHSVERKRDPIGRQGSESSPASRHKKYLAIGLAGIAFKL